MNNQNGLQLESLSRIVQHNEKYDCAMISGYLSKKEDGGKNSPPRAKKRHAKLLAELKMYNYFVISLKGAWRNEDGEIEKEESFFVVNRGKGKSEEEQKHLQRGLFTVS